MGRENKHLVGGMKASGDGNRRDQVGRESPRGIIQRKMTGIGGHLGGNVKTP